jgi:hypothetical protein
MPKAANCRRPRGSLLESYWLVDAVCPIYLASVENDSTAAEAGTNVEKDYSESMDPYLWSYSSAYGSVVLSLASVLDSTVCAATLFGKTYTSAVSPFYRRLRGLGSSVDGDESYSVVEAGCGLGLLALARSSWTTGKIINAERTAKKLVEATTPEPDA